jgi:hypothetical protein
VQIFEESALKYTETSDGCTVFLFHRMVKKRRVSEHLLPPIKPWVNQNDSKNSFCKTHQEEWTESFARKRGHSFCEPFVISKNS